MLLYDTTHTHTPKDRDSDTNKRRCRKTETKRRREIHLGVGEGRKLWTMTRIDSVEIKSSDTSDPQISSSVAKTA